MSENIFLLFSRRRNLPDETTALTSAAYGYQQQNAGQTMLSTGLIGVNSSTHDLEMGQDQLLGPDSSEQEILPGAGTMSNKAKMGARIRGAYGRRQYSAAGASAAGSIPGGQGVGAPDSVGTKTKTRLGAAQGTRRANRFRDVVQATQAAQMQDQQQSSRGASPLPPPPSSNAAEFDPSAALTVV